MDDMSNRALLEAVEELEARCEALEKRVQRLENLALNQPEPAASEQAKKPAGKKPAVFEGIPE